jgi:hypothetical protein
MAEFRIRSGRDGQINGVDPQLLSILKAAAANAPAGIAVVEAYSGKAGRSTGTTNHPSGRAVDLDLFDASGRKLDNYRGTTGGKMSAAERRDYQTFERFAQVARQTQQQMYPGLSDKFRWGGYFQGGVNPVDQMHFDLSGGRRGLPSQTDRWANGLQVGALAGVSQGSKALAGQPDIQVAEAPKPAPMMTAGLAPNAYGLLTGGQPPLASYAAPLAPAPAVAAVNAQAAGVPIIQANLETEEPPDDLSLGRINAPRGNVQVLESVEIPKGPARADAVVRAAMDGDPAALKAALLQTITAATLDPTGNAKTAVMEYLGSIPEVAPGATRIAQENYAKNPALREAVPSTVRSSIDAAIGGLAMPPRATAEMPIPQPRPSPSSPLVAMPGGMPPADDRQPQRLQAGATMGAGNSSTLNAGPLSLLPQAASITREQFDQRFDPEPSRNYAAGMDQYRAASPGRVSPMAARASMGAGNSMPTLNAAPVLKMQGSASMGAGGGSTVNAGPLPMMAQPAPMSREQFNERFDPPMPQRQITQTEFNDRFNPPDTRAGGQVQTAQRGTVGTVGTAEAAPLPPAQMPMRASASMGAGAGTNPISAALTALPKPDPGLGYLELTGKQIPTMGQFLNPPAPVYKPTEPMPQKKAAEAPAPRPRQQQYAPPAQKGWGAGLLNSPLAKALATGPLGAIMSGAGSLFEGGRQGAYGQTGASFGGGIVGDPSSFAQQTPSGNTGYSIDPNSGLVSTSYGYSFTTNPDGTSNVYY